MRPEVVAAMQVASRKYVTLDELHDAVGKRIAELLDCQAALVTAGCASALSLATAACVAGSDRERIRRLPDTTGMKNEVLVQRTHRVGYDHAIRNAGVTHDRGRDSRGARKSDQRAHRDDVLPQLRPTRRGRSTTRNSSRSARSTTSRP